MQVLSSRPPLPLPGCKSAADGLLRVQADAGASPHPDCRFVWRAAQLGLRRVLHTRRGRSDSDALHGFSLASSTAEQLLDRRKIEVRFLGERLHGARRPLVRSGGCDPPQTGSIPVVHPIGSHRVSSGPIGSHRVVEEDFHPALQAVHVSGARYPHDPPAASGQFGQPCSKEATCVRIARVIGSIPMLSTDRSRRRNVETSKRRRSSKVEHSVGIGAVMVQFHPAALLGGSSVAETPRFERGCRRFESVSPTYGRHQEVLAFVCKTKRSGCDSPGDLE